MNRRHFLYATAASLVGAVKASGLPLSLLPLQQQWLGSYLTALGATPVNQLLVPDQELNAQLQTSAQSLFTVGYKAFGSTLYYTSEDQVAMYPLALHSPDTGLIDLTVLFFRKDASTNHSWKYTHTFSGFELEAICQAMSHLPVQPDKQEAIALFVPVYEVPHQRRPYCFKTASGQLELKVKIEESKTRLDFKLVKGNSDWVDTSFISRHFLCCRSLA
ncbi:hypothetical protein [Telluribacter sp.]|uniref:hypothetical protein n=1 Tax=Telluribacter sp. TaxID=1978767 RepID=UPI002E14B4B3|nr:hypothetical protein [Telluribacter sp.]